MTQGTNSDAADKILVFFTLVIPEATSLSPNKGQWDSRVRLKHVCVCQLLYVIHFIIHILTFNNLI
jgi:hypothetical protein